MSSKTTIRLWYARMRAALALTGPVLKNTDYRFHLRSTSNPIPTEERRRTFLASQMVNLEPAAEDKSKAIEWLAEHWHELDDTYELATKDIPVLRDIVPGVEPLRPAYMALELLRRDRDWIDDRMYLCERAEEEEWGLDELEARFRESDAIYPFKSEIVTELQLKLDEEKSHLVNCVAQTDQSEEAIATPKTCDTAFEAAEVCERVMQLATDHRRIGEVATMPVVKAVAAILDYMRRADELWSKWVEVEAGGWLRGYKWDYPSRTSTATRAALEQASANCTRIWESFEDSIDTLDALARFLQKAIDRGDDIGPFVAASIEAIKNRVPVDVVAAIDFERRYILESNAKTVAPHDAEPTAIRSNSRRSEKGESENIDNTGVNPQQPAISSAGERYILAAAIWLAYKRTENPKWESGQRRRPVRKDAFPIAPANGYKENEYRFISDAHEGQKTKYKLLSEKKSWEIKIPKDMT